MWVLGIWKLVWGALNQPGVSVGTNELFFFVWGAPRTKSGVDSCGPVREVCIDCTWGYMKLYDVWYDVNPTQNSLSGELPTPHALFHLSLQKRQVDSSSPTRASPYLVSIHNPYEHISYRHTQYDSYHPNKKFNPRGEGKNLLKHMLGGKHFFAREKKRTG